MEHKRGRRKKHGKSSYLSEDFVINEDELLSEIVNNEQRKRAQKAVYKKDLKNKQNAAKAKKKAAQPKAKPKPAAKEKPAPKRGRPGRKPNSASREWIDELLKTLTENRCHIILEDKLRDKCSHYRDKLCEKRGEEKPVPVPRIISKNPPSYPVKEYPKLPRRCYKPIRENFWEYVKDKEYLESVNPPIAPSFLQLVIRRMREHRMNETMNSVFRERELDVYEKKLITKK